MAKNLAFYDPTSLKFHNRTDIRLIFCWIYFSMKIRNLLGTFLVRQRANGQFALLLKVFNVFNSCGVKSMKIQEESKDGKKEYFLSVNRKFTSLARLVAYYKRKDLTA